jgi:predicted NUDIX family NTP pyrophosphohydrolase
VLKIWSKRQRGVVVQQLGGGISWSGIRRRAGRKVVTASASEVDFYAAAIRSNERIAWPTQGAS